MTMNGQYRIPQLQYGLHIFMPGRMMGNGVPGMMGSVVPGMTGSVVPGMTGSVVPGMTGSVVPGMTSSVVPGMTGGMVPGMTGNIMSGLPMKMMPIPGQTMQAPLMSLNTLSGLSMSAGLSSIDDPGLYESNLSSLKHAYVLEKSKAGYHVCSMCLQHFPDKSTLDRHNRTLICVCLRHEARKYHSLTEFNSPFKHNLRVGTFHVKMDEYTCAVCMKSFSKKSRLKRHFLTHTGRRPHQCTYCKKRFAQKSDLVMHVRIHTGERPFQCKICDKRFTQKVHLNVHTRVRRPHTHTCYVHKRKPLINITRNAGTHR